MQTKSNKIHFARVLHLYGLFLVVYFSLRFLFGNSLNVVACLDNCIPVALFPTILILPISIKKRSRLTLLWSSLAVLFLIFEFGYRFFPRNSRNHNDLSSSIRVLSHNTAQDLPNFHNIHMLIHQSNADVVILQEITKGNIDQYWPKLLNTYPYQVYGPLQDEKQIGMGILSRYPLINPENFKLANDGLVFQQKVLVNISGTVISLYNIHLTFPWIRLGSHPIFSRLPWPFYDDEIRRQEINQLIELLQREPNPVILAGDFNLSEQSSDYQKLTNFLVDSYWNVGLGFGFTWPANRTPSVNIRPSIPSVRIDYVFHSPSIQTNSAKVLQKTGSDHKPIIVDLTLP